MVAVAVGELAPRPDEEVELAIGRRDRDRRLGRELLERGVDVVREPLEQREVGDRRDQAARQDDLQPADPVGQPAEDDEERRADQQRDSDQRVRRDVVQLQRDDEEEQRVELSRVPHHALPGGRAEQREQHELVVRVLEEAVGERAISSPCPRPSSSGTSAIRAA